MSDVISVNDMVIANGCATGSGGPHHGPSR